MADRISAEQRHLNMQRIKGHDTKLEVAVRRYLFHEGFRFRKNDNSLPGTPDLFMEMCVSYLAASEMLSIVENLNDAGVGVLSGLVRKMKRK